MKYTATLGALALLLAACGGATEATTTASGSTTSSGSLSTTTVPGSTTEGPTITGGSDTTNGPQPTVPPEIAQVAFAFATGDDPRVLVEVSVGETPDGPWSPAGLSDPNPTLTGPSYWVRFDITNTDQLNAVLTDLNISGVDAGSFLGEDICELDAPLPRDGETVCIVGEFPVQPGDHQSDFIVGGFGPRQGGPERWYDPAIPTSLEFRGVRHSFVLVFDTPEGLRVDGTADGPEVEINDFGVSGSVRLDCPEGSPFDGEPALEAYVVQNFSADGSPESPCIDIPTAELEFFSDGNSDNAYQYFGAEATTTTTITATTTLSG
jgi:hypothetical protein